MGKHPLQQVGLQSSDLLGTPEIVLRSWEDDKAVAADKLQSVLPEKTVRATNPLDEI